MILVDTSVWIDHFRAAEPQLVALLTSNDVLCHPLVIGEIALGGVANRAQVLRLLANLPAASAAAHDEAMAFIDTHKLANSGLGLIDTHLLAAAALTPGALLWSRDKALRAAAARLNLDAGLR